MHHTPPTTHHLHLLPRSRRLPFGRRKSAPRPPIAYGGAGAGVASRRSSTEFAKERMTKYKEDAEDADAEESPTERERESPGSSISPAWGKINPQPSSRGGWEMQQQVDDKEKDQRLDSASGVKERLNCLERARRRRSEWVGRSPPAS